MSNIDLNDKKTAGHIAYGLYAASLVIPFAGLAGVIFCYLKRKEHDDPLWTSHMTWLIRTFWISLIAILVSLVLTLVLIGTLTLLATVAWYIYRVVKGWIFWNDGKQIENSEGLF